MKFSRTHHPPPVTGRFRRGYTLMEIMVVVAIIGLVAAMSLPNIFKVMQKEGMRKALSDITGVCADARAKAIFSGQNVAVVFHPLPGEQSFSVEGGGAGHGSLNVSSSALPGDVFFAMLDINQQDYLESKWAKVWFYPNGTSDEMTIVLHDRSDWRKITLEFSTGFAKVTDVDR